MNIAKCKYKGKKTFWHDKNVGGHFPRNAPTPLITGLIYRTLKQEGFTWPLIGQHCIVNTSRA